MTMTTTRITALEKTFVTGHWNHLFIGIWRGPASVVAANEWGRQYEHMAARYPAGFVSLGIVEAQTPIPDGPTRKALTAAMDRAGGGIRAMAGIQEASGFAGAAIRSILLALSNMSRSPFPRRMFGSCTEASFWLASHLDSSAGSVSAEDVLTIINDFRAQVDPRGARAFGASRAVA
jgi:hypothetical protein